MKNSNGFTLVELLSVIVLIGLLIGIGIPGINKISDNMNRKSLEKKISLVESSAILWGQDNKALLQKESNCTTDEGFYSCYKITIKELIEEDYLDSENNKASDPVYNNPLTGENLVNASCEVFVYKKNNRVTAYFGSESCSLITE